jgi:leucine dehydrogenase
MGHEQVVFLQHKDSGLKAIVAIHNTALGPALGGLPHVALRRTKKTRCK